MTNTRALVIRLMIYLFDVYDSFPVNFVSMLVTFALSGVGMGVVVRKRVWDYSITITVIHVLLSALGEFKS